MPTTVAGGLTFESVTAGYSHSCGLTPGGRAYCWGMNGDGQLGDGTKRSVSVGTNHTCGVTTDDKAYCWGLGIGGTLGDGNEQGWTRVPVGECRPRSYMRGLHQR